MEEYGFNQAFEDLAELAEGNLDSEERLQCYSRLFDFVEDLQDELSNIQKAVS